MSDNLPSSDDSQDLSTSEIERIEQDLKQLQPRPVDFDADVILRAAHGEDQPLSPATSPRHERRTVSSRWLTICASWVCGALAGALMTFLLLRADIAPETATDKEHIASNHAAPSPTSNFPQNTPDDRPERTAKPTSKVEVWPDTSDETNSALLVSSPVWELCQSLLVSVDQPSLRAGNHMRLRAASLSRPNPTPESAASDEQADGADRTDVIADEVPIHRSLNREELLEEVLGVAPDSVL